MVRVNGLLEAVEVRAALVRVDVVGKRHDASSSEYDVDHCMATSTVPSALSASK